MGNLALTGSPAVHGLSGRPFLRPVILGAILALSGGRTAAGDLLPSAADAAALRATAAETGLHLEWTRPEGPVRLAGWRVERRDPDGSVAPVSADRIQPGLFDSPATVYRVSDPDVRSRVGDIVYYRLVSIDAEWREHPADFAPLEVEVAPPASPELAGTESPVWKHAKASTPPGPRVRLAVTNDGIHRVTAAQIAAALEGYNESQVAQAIAQTQLAMSTDGEPVAWRAEPGGGALLFFGQARRDTYDRRGIYWIKPGPGLSMASENRATAQVAADPWFWETIRVEQNLHFMPYLPGGAEDDYWVWAGQQVTTPDTSWTWSTTVPLVDRHSLGTAGQVTAHLISAYDGPAALDNRTRLSAAGHLLDDRSWAGDARLAQSGISTHLSGTSVVVSVEIRREPDISTTTVLIDAVDVTYARRVRALNGRLLFRPEPGATVATARGFASSGIRLFDVSQPLRPVDVTATLAQEGSEWRASWTVDPAAPGRFAVAATFLSPASIEGAPDAGWGGPSPGAPHVVVAPRALTNAATALVAHRREQGLDSILVPMEELFDDFAHGRRDPRAIPRFLAHAAAAWTVPPEWVCLAGDGHLDYHDHHAQSQTRPNHVPPLLARIPYGTPGGGTMATLGVDNPLADIDGDGLPDLIIGRLPAQTPAALSGMIQRIIVHESSSAWKSPVLLVSDKDADQAFDNACDRLAARIPSVMTTRREGHTLSMPAATMRTNFLRAMNAGPVLAVYMGHANNVGISSPYFFEHSFIRSHMSSLTNTQRTPVFLGGTCMLNNFSQPHPDNRCIGKGFLDTAPGGAVAVWASAAENTLEMAEAAIGAILDELFATHDERLGDLIGAALERQATGASPWVVCAGVLLGDPGMRVRTHAHNTWDAGHQSLGGGWRRLAWFGDYIPMGGWIFHHRHGFWYPATVSTPQSIWFFTQDMGWLWTSSTLYPFLYRQADGAWPWYNGSSSPRWFRNMTAGQWEYWP